MSSTGTSLSHVESWIVDYISPDVMAYRKRVGADRAMAQAPFKFRPPDWPGFFAAHGWRQREVHHLPIEGARLGRRPPLPWAMRLLMTLLRPLTPPERRARFATSAGYVLLEPADKPVA
jgi:hypothetical protein